MGRTPLRLHAFRAGEILRREGMVAGHMEVFISANPFYFSFR
jgi:hypothetical protein